MSLPVTSYEDVDTAFARAEQVRVGAVLIETSELTLLFSGRIVETSAPFTICPACTHGRPKCETAALISYGPAAIENISGAAAYVERLLKGATVYELPFVEPTEIKLTINVRTARSLGIVLPPSLLVRADEVIE